MYGKALEVGGLKVSISLDGGIEIEMVQLSPVTVTVVLDGAIVSCVHADEGIEFVSDGGLLSLSYKNGANITELCDRKVLAKRLRDMAEENEAMLIHVTSIKGKL